MRSPLRVHAPRQATVHLRAAGRDRVDEQVADRRLQPWMQVHLRLLDDDQPAPGQQRLHDDRQQLPDPVPDGA